MQYQYSNSVAQPSMLKVVQELKESTKNEGHPIDECPSMPAKAHS
jgi:hypothetical protein